MGVRSNRITGNAARNAKSATNKVHFVVDGKKHWASFRFPPENIELLPTEEILHGKVHHASFRATKEHSLLAARSLNDIVGFEIVSPKQLF